MSIDQCIWFSVKGAVSYRLTDIHVIVVNKPDIIHNCLKDSDDNNEYTEIQIQSNDLMTIDI